MGKAGGAKLDAIADMLGHSSTTTTQVYAQIVNKMSKNPARYLETVMRELTPVEVVGRCLSAHRRAKC